MRSAGKKNYFQFLFRFNYAPRWMQYGKRNRYPLILKSFQGKNRSIEVLNLFFGWSQKYPLSFFVFFWGGGGI